MTVISKSTIDARTFAKILLAVGGTIFFLGILKFEMIISLAGIGILAIGVLLYFLGKATYTITYDQKSQNFEIKNRQKSLTVNKKDILGLHKRITLFQTWWPLERHYYYVLSAKNESGKKAKYRFVIWTDEPLLLRNYGMLRRSVEQWTNGNVN